MRSIAATLGLFMIAAAPTMTAAQEVGDSITLTGCLAREEDDQEVEFLLEAVDPELTAATEVQLEPEEGVTLEPHVGHTVEITGVVLGPDDEDEPEEEKGQELVELELHVRVTAMRHISGSCEPGG